MWLANDWEDYALLDCGDAQRLERWGDVFLVRPDPQAIWQKEGSHAAWKAPNAQYFRSEKGGGSWQLFNLDKKQWSIRYKNLTFGVKPMNFKHTGIFPEQAANWDFSSDMIARAGRPISLLNLFAYTGGATLAAAAAGAEVCHVDAARGMVSWARENAVLSGLSGHPVRWIVDDCIDFISREIRRGRRYDAIIMDPPSYGRGPTGQLWKIEDDLYRLIELTKQVLSPDPLFFIINIYSGGLAPSVSGYMLGRLLCPEFGGTVRCDELGLPVEKTGLALPCGATARWQSA